MAWSLLDSGTALTAAAGSGYAYTYPAGAPGSGDLLVLGVSSATTVSTPSGWTLSTNASYVSGLGGYVFWKVAGASEPSSVTVTTSGNDATAIGFMRWSGAATSPFDIAAYGEVDGSDGYSTQPATITLTSTGELLTAWGLTGYDATTAAASPAWNLSITQLLASGLEGTGGNQAQLLAGYLTGASGTYTSASVSWTASSAYRQSSRYTILLAFLPSAGGTNATVTMSSYLAVTTSQPAVTVTTGSVATAYASSYDSPVGGQGTWVNPANAEGAPDGSYATWVVS